MVEQVKDYIGNVLRPQLETLNISEQFQSYIESTVTKQMESALFNWKYSNMVHVFLTLVSEESHFYSPEAPEDVKAFVVLTLRNSPLESLQSDNYAATGLSHKITNEQLKEITSAAIRYFAEIDLVALSETVELGEGEDIYGELWDEYIIAWKALEEISKSEEQSCSFSSYARDDKDSLLLPFRREDTWSYADIYVAHDGYEPYLDQALLKQLEGIARDQAVFFVDCFKMLSRNPKIVLAAIEYLLSHDAIFVSSNYLLCHTYAERRSPILKAASSANVQRDIRNHLNNKTGLLPMHKKMLSLVTL